MTGRVAQQAVSSIWRDRQMRLAGGSLPSGSPDPVPHPGYTTTVYTSTSTRPLSGTTCSSVRPCGTYRHRTYGTLAAARVTSLVAGFTKPGCLREGGRRKEVRGW